MLDICHELDDLGGGRFRHVQHLRPIAYSDGGTLRRIVSDWTDGDASFPHAITTAPMLCYVAADGMRRVCPTRDPARYLEIGAPYVKSGATWQKVAFGQATRTGNKITWSRTQADLSVTHAGHFIKLDIALKGGYVPPNNQFAFPVGMQGLTRQGGQILADGVPGMSLRPPVVYDAANESDVRPIAWDFATVSGQPYLVFTLPDLAGMASPVVDPTLTKQPDGTEGQDTSIRSTYPTYNWGNSTAYIYVGNTGSGINRVLIRFNLSTLPTTAAVSSTVLSLCARDDYSTNARTYRAFRLKRGWVEGTGAGTVSNDGASWNTYDGSNAWQTPGAFGTDDCEQSDIGSRAMTATETLNEFKDFSLTPVTKTALDLGNGWLIKADTENSDGYTFYPSEYATYPERRPKLTIDYTLPATFKPWFVPRSNRIIGGGVP